jgi:multiple sugar transport system permease protein
VYFLPVVVSSVATALIAAWLFNDNYGVVNAVLKQAGAGPVAWLSTPQWALPSIILTTLWVRIGFCMVVYLAALQSISPSYYEAAVIDGASRPQQFLYVTWPLLRPTTFLLLILNVIYSFQVFDLIYVMTGGGPGFSTTMIVQYIYRAAFANSEMGYASAMGMVLFVLILLFTLVQWRINRRTEQFV